MKNKVNLITICMMVSVAAGLIACAEQGLKKPRMPNITLRENMSLRESLIWANYQYELGTYENALREQEAVRRRDEVAEKLEQAISLKIKEEEIANTLEAEFESNELLIHEKSRHLKEIVSLLQANSACRVKGRQLVCMSPSGKELWVEYEGL